QLCLERPPDLIWIKPLEAAEAAPVFFATTEKTHETSRKVSHRSVRVRVCVLYRLVGARRHFAGGRECPGTGRPPADARERCGCCAPTKSAGSLWRWRRRRCRDRHGC